MLVPTPNADIASAGNSGANPIAEGLRAMRRLRRVATALLLFATALFAAATWKESQWPWLGFVAAFAEAAMVGAIADWFALTALFRRPLGLPIPYTAIIPRNQIRIARAIGGFVSTNLLAAKAAAQRLIEIDPAGRLGKWLSTSGNAETTARRIVETLPPPARHRRRRLSPPYPAHRSSLHRPNGDHSVHAGRPVGPVRGPGVPQDAAR